MQKVVTRQDLGYNFGHLPFKWNAVEQILSIWPLSDLRNRWFNASVQCFLLQISSWIRGLTLQVISVRIPFCSNAKLMAVTAAFVFVFLLYICIFICILYLYLFAASKTGFCMCQVACTCRSLWRRYSLLLRRSSHRYPPTGALNLWTDSPRSNVEIRRTLLGTHLTVLNLVFATDWPYLW